MTEKLKKKWLCLYAVAQQINMMQPWNDFSESDKFTYIWKDKSKSVFFSFIGESAQKCGIACYIGEEDYIRARVRLTEKNAKHEPIFMLQNALICLWDNREDLSKESYALIKELGFKPCGKGSWLHFDKYKIGYTPIPLDEKEIDLLTTAFENLHMMLRAIYEQGLDPEFDKGKNLVRWYEPKDKLFYTHPFEIEISKDIITHPHVTVQENDWMNEVRSMKNADYSVEIDWSYVDVVYKDEEGRGTFPRMLLAIEPKEELILVDQMLSPSHNQPNVIFNMLDHLVEQYGKPSEIAICDEDLKGILSDACKKVGIKLTVRKRLSAVNNARKTILTQII